ncbi:acetoacetate--CoA ligase [Brevibacterium senegalense]|uniref:acetoacetate--CoA ligase n=1 Tax=Brevibacterium senegalense TaxID=1033736 RepID=UPI00030DEE1F|nr:acetoacetate--CoA ligase [Brevibacterium senegalense]
MPESSAVLWRPDPAAADASQMREFQRLMGERHDAPQGDYQEFWRWTIANLDVFWEEIIAFAGVVWERGDGPVREGDTMPDVRWFPGARINYAENILRWSAERGDEPAIIGRHEDDRREVLTWNQLRGQVGALAARLREWGVQPGDTVAAVLPNLPQTAVALLAAASVGAVWSVVNTDFGVRGIADRFAQIEPKVLFTADSVLFNGKHVPLTEAVPGILEVLPTVERHVLIEQTGGIGAGAGTGHSSAQIAVPEGREIPSKSFDDLVASPEEPIFERVEFSHPLWVLYSSGTTGKPKGIVHGHGGVTVEMNRANILQYDVRPGDIQYSAVATTWVVWNLLIDAMSRGVTIVTYDGAPFAGGPHRQFELLASERATAFGTGAAVLSTAQRLGYSPRADYDFSALRSILSTGSPLPDPTWDWVYEHMSPTVKLGSDSGGTDIASGFIGSNPVDPVARGHLQCAYLGIAADSWDSRGNPVVGELGEFVVTEPMPSMPVFFWNDPDGSRYRDAYFDAYPGVWRHGDWVTRHEDGSYVIHGRSDATINRGGIRMGSADITQIVDRVEGVAASMVIGAELTGGDYYMPLFVVPAPGTQVDDALRERIVAAIRSELSPRYVPDEIIEAPGVPLTRTGKLLELPIKRVLQGAQPTTVNRDAAADEAILEWYVDFAQTRRADSPAD